MPEAPRAPGSQAAAGPPLAGVLVALVVGQLCLHSTMAGLRMAAPLWILQHRHGAWSVGVVVGLFACAPIVLALHAGRLADRLGYHRPLQVSVALAVGGGLFAVAAAWLPSVALGCLCLAAMLSGAGANYGLITIQRTAGRTARNGTELKRVFGWLGLAPALSNVAGPVLAGALIDLADFRVAFAVLALLPMGALWWARRVPREPPAVTPARAATDGAWALLNAPGVRRLLIVNWLLSASWDVHTFVVPILGHERGLHASTIGMVLGSFATAVALMRLLIPAVAHRLREAAVLRVAMFATAAVFAVYPLVRSAWAMAACSVSLGLSLGAVQPMVMTMLHELTPHDRHGQALALRSMTINLSSATMPLAFGLVGAALGSATLFWIMGALVWAGTAQARRLRVGAH